MYDEDNDGRFPDESPVEVRYPRSEQEEYGDRERWPWLQCSSVFSGTETDRGISQTLPVSLLPGRW